MSEVTMVILSKLYSIQNRIRKNEIIQTVPIPKSCDLYCLHFLTSEMCFLTSQVYRTYMARARYTTQQHVALPPTNELYLLMLF